MARLEDIKRGSTVEGIIPNRVVSIIDVQWHGDNVLQVTYKHDPGAGKTIMAGLLIKELMVSGDVRRCLIVCPGNLTEQWQDELYSKFGLNFELITRDRIQNSLTGNPFEELELGFGRLDHLSRSDDLLAKLEKTDWDLVICDEAHKMSATYFGSEVKYTKRYHLGRLLSRVTRHFLLMTATPHNGKEQDFQLFMALLDGDRFEGKYRDSVHTSDPSDLMRRMVKEKLVRFDGTPLFPEKRACTPTSPNTCARSSTAPVPF